MFSLVLSARLPFVFSDRLTASTASTPQPKSKEGSLKLQPRLVRTPVAARYLGVTTSTLHRLIAQGELPYISRFKYRLLDVADLEAFISREKSTAGGTR